MNPIRIPRFEGMNNRLPDFVNRKDDKHYVRNAVNVDLTDAGTVKRRQGVTRMIPGTDCHSLFTVDDVGYYVDYDTLLRVENGLHAVIRTGLTPGRRMAYAVVGHEIVATDGFRLLSIGGVVKDYGLPLPTQIPVLTLGANGSLNEGWYQVAVCYMAADGELGGAVAGEGVYVPEGGALTVSNLDSSGTHGAMVVYMSKPNGETLYSVGPALGPTINFAVGVRYGHRCQTEFLTRMPPGQVIGWLNGRLYVAAGDTLYYSEPYAPALYDPRKNYVQFPAPVSMALPCVDGLFISADQTYFMQGDPTKADLTPVFPYKALLGAAGTFNDSPDVWWMSERGICRGKAGGQATNLQETNVVVEVGTTGAVLMRDEDGMQQLLASVFAPQQTVMAARSYMEAEVIRKETVL